MAPTPKQRDQEDLHAKLRAKLVATAADKPTQIERLPEELQAALKTNAPAAKLGASESGPSHALFANEQGMA